MENLTPLQHCAQQLREEFKRAEEKQKRHQNKLEIEGRLLINTFASSFSTLYSLLIGSSVNVSADTSAVDPVILLTHNENQVSIDFNRTMDEINSWSLFDKIYKSTIPNKNFGMAANREDEHRLIIAIEEILFNSNPKVKEQAFYGLQVKDSVF